MIYFKEDHQYLKPRIGHLKSYFVEEFMQNEAGKFKFCDAIWHASYAYLDGTLSNIQVCIQRLYLK